MSELTDAHVNVIRWCELKRNKLPQQDPETVWADIICNEREAKALFDLVDRKLLCIYDDKNMQSPLERLARNGWAYFAVRRIRDYNDEEKAALAAYAL